MVMFGLVVKVLLVLLMFNRVFVVEKVTVFVVCLLRVVRFVGSVMV